MRQSRFREVARIPPATTRARRAGATGASGRGPAVERGRCIGVVVPATLVAAVHFCLFWVIAAGTLIDLVPVGVYHAISFPIPTFAWATGREPGLAALAGLAAGNATFWGFAVALLRRSLLRRLPD